MELFLLEFNVDVDAFPLEFVESPARLIQTPKGTFFSVWVTKGREKASVFDRQEVRSGLSSRNLAASASIVITFNYRRSLHCCKDTLMLFAHLVYEHQHHLLLIGWKNFVRGIWMLCLFLIHRSRAVYKHQFFFLNVRKGALLGLKISLIEVLFG